MSLGDIKDFYDAVESFFGMAKSRLKDAAGRHRPPRPKKEELDRSHYYDDWSDPTEQRSGTHVSDPPLNIEGYEPPYSEHRNPAARMAEWRAQEERVQVMREALEKEEAAQNGDGEQKVAGPDDSGDEDDETDDDKTVDEQITEGWTPVEQAVLDEDIRAAVNDSECQELLRELEAEVSAREAEGPDVDDADSDDGGSDSAGSSDGGGEHSGDAGSDADWEE